MMSLEREKKDKRRGINTGEGWRRYKEDNIRWMETPEGGKERREKEG